MFGQQDRQRTSYPLNPATTQVSTTFLTKVFSWMATGLALTAVLAFAVAGSSAAQQLIFGNKLIFYALIIGELGMVLYLSARIEKITAAMATALFLIYSALNGVTMAAVLLMYTAASVATTFAVAGGMFAAMAVYGTVTKKDLTGMGSFMFMGLIGIILASLVNMFMHSPAVEWAISVIGVIVFTGLTAYDIQKISRYGGNVMSAGDAAIRKGAIMGALSLYLDFINLFLSLLRLLGDRR